MSAPQNTLPARYYTDPDVFRRELDSFFSQMWVNVGRAEQIPNPGDYFLASIAGESLIVTRNADNSINAFFNVCRHRGTRLCRVDDPAAGNGTCAPSTGVAPQQGKFPGRIQCPYHGWTYALDGKLLGAPHMDDPGFRREDYPLHAVHCDTWDGHIFLNLTQPPPQALAAQLGSLREKFAPWRMAELRLHKRVSYDVHANWKLIVLNYNECLHCPVLHPVLHRITDYLSGDNDEPDAAYIGGSMAFRGAAQTMSLDGARRRDYLPGLTEAQRQQVLYYAILPNLFLSLHPDYVMLHRLWPIAHDRTQVVCEWYFDPAEMAKPAFAANDVIDFWDMTNREDWGVSELSQQGIGSRAYVPGPYSPREGLPKAFDRLVLERERNYKPSAK